ncbi:MAG: inosine monophosphate cyclohydrolase [Anaerolineae bacterium]|nr:inosine monophosphate cyclohydrolase [Anaerolineae bacterium]
MDIFERAEQNLDRHLRRNSYPGRGLIVGRAGSADAWVQVYWIMGRSTHSRNRRFVVDGSTLRTEPVDISMVKDPSLIIYEAMLELPDVYLVTNGDQTRTIYRALHVGGTFEDALLTREREPDPPNYTPRISAMLDLRAQTAQIALNILKANKANPELTDHTTWRPAPPPAGLGYCITTYMGDGSPLPSFDVDPLLMPLQGGAEEILSTCWDALDVDNRISLAVKWITNGELSRLKVSELTIRNRFGDA